MKKFLNHRGVKKFFIALILVIMVFFSSIVNVYARTLTIDEVSTQFDKSSIVEGLNQSGSSTIASQVNTTDKTLDIYTGTEKVFSFVYGDDYIEYNNRDFVVTEENSMDTILPAFMSYGVMESIFVLSGYENKTLKEDEDYTNTYDTYGIQLETESYQFSGEEEDGSSYNISGDYIKYFKISLDTDKIDALIETYGVDVDEENPYKETINSLTPTLVAKEVTENSVSLYPTIPYTSNDPDYLISCYIYRSDSENGTYEKISEATVNCSQDSGVGMVDKDLKSNTTYYYKTIVQGGTIYSSPVAVTTKGAASSNTNDVDENPKTGMTVSLIMIALTSIVSVSVMIYMKKKSVFNRI